MARHILFCKNCQNYTMMEECSQCGEKAVTVRPPKYSPDDRYAGLKREVKEEEYLEKGFL